MQYRFCPLCGNALNWSIKTHSTKKRLYCARCEFVHYDNPKTCVGAVIAKNGKILLTRRANEPFKDHWDFPGGFLVAGEHSKDGLRRELDEELKIGVKIGRIVGIYPDFYGPDGDATLNIYYLCKIANGEITPRPYEIAEAKWFSPNALPAKLAFGHVQLVLDEWRKLYALKRSRAALRC